MAPTRVNDHTEQSRKPKILVCDDDLMVRLLARECLEEAGMDVVEASDGDDALQRFEEESPDLVFLDVEMPGKTGFEVCEAIRSSDRGSATPILIATGADDRDSIDRGYNAGATQYKSKPVNWSLLSRDIRYMLRASQAFLELKAQEQRLRYLAYFDHLTGLPNRRSFSEQLRRSLEESAQNGSNTGLFFVNIDHFKRINDSIGYERGDQLLKAVATKLHDRLEQLAPVTSDFSETPSTRIGEGLYLEMARPGGDEFSVIAHNAPDMDQLKAIGDAVLEAFTEAVTIENQHLVITPSIGIAMAPDHGTAPESLLRRADAAMHAAKADGRGRLRMYDDSLDDDAAEKLRLEADLRGALDSGEQLYMVYQPQIDTANGRVSGVEALIRWKHPELGDISPVKFIPIAESSGLILKLGDTILRRVCADALSSGDRFPDNVAISINLSPLQFNQSDFIGHIRSTLAELDVRFKIELELTEGVIMSDAEGNLSKLKQLKEYGFDLAIDDFGTGYSSLSYLRNFPIDTLKIDRSFVNDLGTPDGNGIVKAILSLSEALGLRVVAEGVETREQAAFLCAHGCTCLQGFLLARPLSVDQLLIASEQDYSEYLVAPAGDSQGATPPQ